MMTSAICPHCHAIRPGTAQAPAWQCPACGKAYAKAPVCGMEQRPPTPTVPRDHGGLPWHKLLAGAVLAYGLWVGFQHLGGASGLSRASRFGGDVSAQQLTQLAASHPAGDVLFYSADWCPNCRAAKAWMQEYGFKYEECNVETSSACASQLRVLDPEGGIPYLIVRGEHMKNGFDSEQFVLALSK